MMYPFGFIKRNDKNEPIPAVDLVLTDKSNNIVGRKIDRTDKLSEKDLFGAGQAYYAAERRQADRP